MHSTVLYIWCFLVLYTSVRIVHTCISQIYIIGLAVPVVRCVSLFCIFLYQLVICAYSVCTCWCTAYMCITLSIVPCYELQFLHVCIYLYDLFIRTYIVRTYCIIESCGTLVILRFVYITMNSLYGSSVCADMFHAHPPVLGGAVLFIMVPVPLYWRSWFCLQWSVWRTVSCRVPYLYLCSVLH